MVAFEHSVLCVGKAIARNAGLSFFTFGRITVKIVSGGGDLHRKAVSKPCHKSDVSYFSNVVISFLQKCGMGKPCRHNTLTLAGLKLRIVLHIHGA